MCVCVCLAGPVEDGGHGRSNGGRRDAVVRGGGAGALVPGGGGPSVAVLADEGPVLVELDVHAVPVLCEGVVAA